VLVSFATQAMGKIRKNQKILRIIFTSLAGPAVACLFCVSLFNISFFPSSFISNAAIFIAMPAGFSALGILWMLERQGLWEPDYNYIPESVVKRAFLFLFAPFFLSFVFWLLLTFPIPLLYTYLFGNEVEVDFVASKAKFNRRSSLRCQHQLEFEELSHSAFSFFCISPEKYKKLVSGKVPSKVVILQSNLGLIVKDVYIDSKYFL
jgi:hypothetical protein